jgi:IS30 family transposase
MKTYNRLNLSEREEISRNLAIGNSIRSISQRIQRHPSTVSREINSCVVDKKYYRAIFAQQYHNKMARKQRANRKLETNPALRQTVLGYLNKKWSPQQIAKRLKVLYPNDMTMQVSHETIYSFIYVLPRGSLKKEIVNCLRRKHQYRRPRKPERKNNSGAIQDYLSIEERPVEVAERIVPGHWEGDLLMGSRNASAIGTLVERTSRMTFLVKLENKDAKAVREAFAEEFKVLPPGLKRTLTYDQGQEMAQHKVFTKETNISVYFAHPRSPWERGTNENTNMLLRQYFPKGTNFNKISKERLKEVQDELNDRPRKTLNWYTPHERFGELLR